MIKNKGFTLIEILAVIIILGIIAIIVVPISANYIFKARESIYEEHENSMKVAAQNMTTECLLDNKKGCKVPVSMGSRRVYLDELIENGYLDELKDPRSDNYCDETLSYVTINNTGDANYDYKVCLVCSEYTTENEMCTSVSHDKPTCGKITTETSSLTNKNQTITVECIDSDAGCTKRRFTKVFTSEDEEKTIKIQDNKGEEVLCDVSSAFLIDKTLPVCTLRAEAEVFENGKYYGPVKVKLSDTSDSGSGISDYGIGMTTRVMYDKNTTLDMPFGITNVTGYVKDKAGNENTCKLTVERVNDYKLIYNDNKGSGCSNKNQNVIYKYSYNVYGNLCTPARTGYTFTGWFTKENAGEKIENTTKMTNKSDTTIYAHWSANTYTVAFNGNGNTGGSITDKTCTYDEDCILPNNTFVKTGYLFLGWSTESDGNLVYQDKQNVKNIITKGNITLYAKWKPHTYTIAYHGNNGTGSMENQVCFIDSECKLNNNAFTRTGYTYDDWATSSGGGKAYTNGQIVKNITGGGQTIDFYARWNINTNTLTVNPNGGTVAFDGANRTSSTSKTQNYNTTIDYGKPSRGNSTASAGSYTVSYSANGGNSTPGAQSAARTTTTSYTFSSWTTSGTCGNLTSTNNSGTYTYPANSGTTCTMTANWSSSPSTTTAAVTLASAIGRGGYNFAGWKSSTNNVTYSARTSYTPTANTTMTAQWTPVNYSITYNLNSGSISGQKTSYNIETASFTLPTPTRSNCRFNGWTGTGLSSATKTVTVAKGSTGNRSYTANWYCGPFYAYGVPTTSSTTNYTTLGKKVFVELNGSQYSVCIIKNNQLHCFKNSNYAYEKNHVQQVFGSSTCRVESQWLYCETPDFYCFASSVGVVSCYDEGTNDHCRVNGYGSVECD